ncbi:hypothetical protein GCM10009775_04660 [Microbacterium aoyamense]|uniref:Uncharacterized protein n=1 Tax=Microbacterium aoyamense TaxID=344166 RepID=A0ABN2P963_9MICO|nr:hypothetical protein [Microbacterium aoyamense]
MTIRVYATPDDYNEVAEEPVEDTTLIAKRLRSASVEVEKLTRRASYTTDEDGFPTDETISDAFTEATCAIVEHWQDTDDPRGVDAASGAVSILSVSLGTTSSGKSGLTERDKLAQRIGDKAIDILTNAGLIGSAVAHS